MTRAEAIKNIVDRWRDADSEFCCSRDEFKYSANMLKESLAALAVVDAEMGPVREVFASVGLPIVEKS